MRQTVISLALVLIFSFVMASSAPAGGRYYNSGYSNHHRSSHYYYRHKNHHYAGTQFLSYLGVGLITGALVSGVINSHPRQKAVIYTSAPQVAVTRYPVIQSGNAIPVNYPSPEVIVGRVTITAQLLNVRSTPDVESNVTEQVQRGMLLDVIGAAPDWLYIKTRSGRYGWIMQQFTQTANGPVG